MTQLRTAARSATLPAAMLDDDARLPARPSRGPWTIVAIAWVLGITLGHAFPSLYAWLMIGAATCLVMAIMLRRRRLRAVRCWGLLSVVALGAGWLVLHTHYVQPRNISRYLAEQSQLAQVTGVVDGMADLRSPLRGAFGQFTYESPSTMFVLDLRSILVRQQPTPAAGKLLVRVDQADHRLAPGQTISATGWLSRIGGPMNPGEIDFRKVLAARGIEARLTLHNRGNWQLLAEPSPISRWTLSGLRRSVGVAFADSLRLGMDDQTASFSLLQTLLLGERSRNLGDLEDSFRKVGLAHLLSISGAHLGILLWLVWLVVRLLVPHPARATALVLAVLAIYLLAVPPHVPVIRAGIMASLFLLGYATGRKLPALDLLAIAAIITLLWRPQDLFNPGFQLSFGIVAALLLFAKPVALWMLAPPLVQPTTHLWARRVWWGLINYLAVSIVAFIIALPLVALHFQMVNPLAVLLSVLSLPLLTAVLGLGYLKILLGLFLPSAGLLLSEPLRFVATTLASLVDEIAAWPGVWIELTCPPSIAWTLLVLFLGVALFSGWFARRKRILAAVTAILIGWTFLTQHHATADWVHGRSTNDSAAIINMFAVGDGSCYLLRTGGRTLMFDCGSQAYLDIGHRNIVPALRQLGVFKIDLLLLSHADLDHYSGSLDLIDGIHVSSVLLPPQMIAEARQSPSAATGFLLAGLQKRDRTPQVVAQGWRENMGQAQLELLWPPPQLATKAANDTSLVLSVRIAGRRILLNGDIQQQAIPMLLDSGIDLRADITDLPHHGSMVDDSIDWLNAVSPTFVLQSCGPARLYQDKWADFFATSTMRRLISEQRGMVELRIDWQGRITESCFTDDPHPR
jgi:competence protein ComEC